jgi:hypothetical protein
MKSKLWVLFLGFILLLAPLGPAARAQSTANEPSKLDAEVAKIKAAISKRVADDKARVKIKSRDGVELKGRLTQAGTDEFSFTDEKSGRQMTMAYTDVARVNGRGLSSGAKIGIIGAIVVGVAAIVLIKAARDFDPFRNGIPLRGISF